MESRSSARAKLRDADVAWALERQQARRPWESITASTLSPSLSITRNHPLPPDSTFTRKIERSPASTAFRAQLLHEPEAGPASTTSPRAILFGTCSASNGMLCEVTDAPTFRFPFFICLASSGGRFFEAGLSARRRAVTLVGL